MPRRPIPSEMPYDGPPAFLTSDGRIVDRPPCGCGNPDARWHDHPRIPGRREYACDACAPRAR